MEDYEIENHSGIGMLEGLDPLIDQVARLTDGQRYWVTRTAKQLAKDYELYGLPEDPFHQIRKDIAKGGYHVSNDPFGTGVWHKLNINSWKETTTKRTKVRAVLTIWDPHKMDDFESGVKSIAGLKNFFRGGDKSRHKLGFEFPFGEVARVYSAIVEHLKSRAEELKKWEGRKEWAARHMAKSQGLSSNKQD